MESAPHYFTWGWVQISVANIIVIATMLLVLAAAIAFRMPAHHDEPRHQRQEQLDDDE